jgi:hypothetical protein
VVEANQKEHGNATTRFLHLDIVGDEVPDGDVCFLRQVLQHLSNQEISAILPKLGKYEWVLITEHYPADENLGKPNLDKVHGGHIRAFRDSGVYLSLPPFSLPEDALELVLEVNGTELEEGRHPGYIRTYLYRPRWRSDGEEEQGITDGQRGQ